MSFVGAAQKFILKAHWGAFIGALGSIAGVTLMGSLMLLAPPIDGWIVRNIGRVLFIQSNGYWFHTNYH